MEIKKKGGSGLLVALCLAFPRPRSWVVQHRVGEDTNVCTDSIGFAEIATLHTEGTEPYDAGGRCGKQVAPAQCQCYRAQGKGVSVLVKGQYSDAKGSLDDPRGSSDTYLVASAINFTDLVSPHLYVGAVALKLVCKSVAYIVDVDVEPVGIELEERIPGGAVHYVFRECPADGVRYSMDQFPIWISLVK